LAFRYSFALPDQSASHDKNVKGFTLKQSHTRKYCHHVRNSMLTGVFACILVAGQSFGPAPAHARAAHATRGSEHSPRHRHVRNAGGSYAIASGGAFGGSGIASVYSGGRTASGEHMNAGAMTAAHRTLPFGTNVTVVNNRNGRAVVVRINDRGPFTRGRIIDLSPAAARAIGVSGLARVSLSVAGGR
jgi:rare lipoprotein A